VAEGVFNKANTAWNALSGLAELGLLAESRDRSGNRYTLTWAGRDACRALAANAEPLEEEEATEAADASAEELVEAQVAEAQLVEDPGAVAQEEERISLLHGMRSAVPATRGSSNQQFVAVKLNRDELENVLLEHKLLEHRLKERYLATKMLILTDLSAPQGQIRVEAKGGRGGPARYAAHASLVSPFGSRDRRAALQQPIQ
jgi:hypothetical protein